MTPANRLRYLLRNAGRMLRSPRAVFAATPYPATRQASTPPLVSPGRAATEAFLRRELPRLLPPRGDMRILDIGCGAGGMASLLHDLGYGGAYIGLDIDDRFDRSPLPGLHKQLCLGDAHTYAPEQGFDLIISMSALEHIPDDAALLRKTLSWMKPGGLQVHIVPSAWALPAYLWHGFRQYALATLGERFPVDRLRVYTLGGLFSFWLHVLFITLPELLLRLRLRQHLPGLYRRLLDGAMALDRHALCCGTFHVAVVTEARAL